MKVNEIANLLGATLVVPEGMSAEVEILKLAPILSHWILKILIYPLQEVYL